MPVPSGALETATVDGWRGLRLEALRSKRFGSDPARPAIIFIHGFPDQYLSFLESCEHFQEQGWDVMSLSLRGYSISAIPADGDMSLHAAAMDIVTVVGALSDASRRQIHLVGHDWGSAVAQIAVRIRSDLFRTLTIAAVPNVKRMDLANILTRPFATLEQQLYHSWYILVFQTPFWRFITGRTGITALINTWDRRRQPYAQWRLKSILDTFDEGEVRYAAVSMYKQNALQLAIPLYGRYSHPATWEQVQKTIDVPTLVLVGEDDACITETTFRIATRAEDFPRGVTLQIMAGVGHYVHWHDGPGFNARVLAFIHGHGHRGDEAGQKNPADASFRSEL